MGINPRPKMPIRNMRGAKKLSRKIDELNKRSEEAAKRIQELTRTKNRVENPRTYSSDMDPCPPTYSPYGF